MNEYDFIPMYSICEESGLRVCEYYQYLLVREDGMVKNISGNYQAKKHWNEGSTDKDGYRTIRVPNTKKTVKIHRLVSFAFIPNPENKSQINHINGLKHDNRLENLDWCTQKENMQHAYDTGLQVAKKGEYSPNYGEKNPRARKIGRYSLDGDLLEEYHGGRQKFKAQGFHHSVISQCCRGRYKTHKGFIWKYLD